MRITGIIIGFDQGSHLDAAFTSLAGVDKLIYGDHGSADDSCEIAKRHGAKVVDVRGMNGSQSRNFCASIAKTDLCLWISPDDVLDPGAIPKIKAHMETSKERGVNIWIREKDGFTFEFPRVFRAGTKWIGRCHEYLESIVTQTIDVGILHTRGPWHDKPSDPEGLLHPLRQDIADDPKNPRWHYFLGRELHTLKRYEEAIPELLACMEIPSNQVAQFADASLYVAKCHTLLHNYSEARKFTNVAIAALPTFKEPYKFMSYLTQGEESNRWFTAWQNATNEGAINCRNV